MSRQQRTCTSLRRKVTDLVHAEDLLKKLLQRAKAEKEEEGEEEEQVISPKKKDKVDDKEFERRLKKIFKDHGHNGQGHLVPPKD